MAVGPNQRPAGGGNVSGSRSPRSGTGGSGLDDTLEKGNYDNENSIFGGPLPSGTGAPGSGGKPPQGDVTNEPGQVDDGLTGLSEADICDTGAPGTATDAGAMQAGGAQVSYTLPGSFGSGTYQSDSVAVDLSGPRETTQANGEGYASGGPQLPGIKGNEPEAGDGRYQPGSGRVLRGGRDVRP